MQLEVVGRMLRLVKAVSSIAFVLIASTPAFSADPVRPLNNWAGFYAGANIGYGWGGADGDFAFAQAVAAPGTVSFASNTSNSADGVIGGLQFGYNWQVRNVLYGIEADIQGSTQKDTTAIRGTFPGIGFVGNSPFTLSNTDQLDWLSTMRGRLGVITGASVVYATGGLAIGKVKSSGVFAPDTSAGGPNVPGVWSTSEVRLGWTIGAGIESAISSQWSWKLEYLYVDLGGSSASSSLPNGNCYGPPGACDNTAGVGSTRQNHDFTDNIVRVGLNYKFH
jgi:outer membrane immunogenic protein